VIVSSLVAPAQAQSGEDVSELGQLPLPEAAPGADKAKAAAPSWCNVVQPVQGYSAGGFRRTLSDRVGVDSIALGAQIACKWPKEPAVAHASGVMAQHVMNWTGLKQPQAMELIGLLGQVDRMKSDKGKLCNALELPEEDEGEEYEFMKARRVLFGCGPNEAQWWSGADLGNADQMISFLDSATQTPDELARTAFVLSRAAYIFNDKGPYFDKRLSSYTIDQVDLGLLSEAAALKTLEGAPYKGNLYARATVMASASRAKLAASLIKAEVAAKAAKDADWKRFLVTTPQGAIEAMNKAAAQYKDELARSAEFEKKLWGPSKNAMKGCWPALRKDFIEVMKPLKHGNEVEAYESLNEPIPALLFGRLVACAAVEQDPTYANYLLATSREVRATRGPRAAAYYAAAATLSEIIADRSKFPISLQDFRGYAPRSALYDKSMRIPDVNKSKFDVMGWIEDGEGTVKSVKKNGDTHLVTFVATKVQVMSQSCTETNKIVMWATDGRPIYYRNCTDTGLVWVDTTPGPINVPDEWVTGIKVGAIVKFKATRGKDTRTGLPVAVYADKKKSKLLNYNGFGL
jgi:hypothetical protein